jgi:SAM-dependent methyltransferase
MFRLVKLQWSIPISYRVSQLQQYFSTKSQDDFIARHFRYSNGQPPLRTLDLGCGNKPRNPFNADILQGVDIKDSQEENVIAADLCLGRIPYPDNYCDFITAFDFIEHIPRVTYVDGRSRFPFVELMSEIYRVLKVGGIFFSHTPAYPSKEAFQDPTHVNIITEDTFLGYFCGDSPYASTYGFEGSYDLIAQEWNHCWLLTLMKKTARRELSR